MHFLRNQPHKASPKEGTDDTPNTGVMFRRKHLNDSVMDGDEM